MDDLHMGDVHLVPIAESPPTCVALMVCQAKRGSQLSHKRTSVLPFRSSAKLPSTYMVRVLTWPLHLICLASVHMPRLGEDVGDTYAVEHLIRSTLGALSVPTSMCAYMCFPLSSRSVTTATISRESVGRAHLPSAKCTRTTIRVDLDSDLLRSRELISDSLIYSRSELMFAGLIDCHLARCFFDLLISASSSAFAKPDMRLV